MRNLLFFLGTLLATATLAAQEPAGDSRVQQLRGQLEALELAQKAGILSEAEYLQKRKEIEKALWDLQTPPVEEVQRKLKALEDAYRAGVLTEEEYLKKKAEIQATLAPARSRSDVTARKKLEALEAARDSGLLSPEEYARKRTALIGPETEKVRAPADLDVELATYRDPKGLFLFGHDRGREVRPLPTGEGAVISHGTGAVSLVIWPNLPTAADVLKGFVDQIRPQWEGFEMEAEGECQAGGQPAPLVGFTGKNPEGVSSRGTIVGLSCGGRGISLARIGPVEDYAALERDWTTLLATVRLAPPAPSGRPGTTYRHPIGFSFWRPEGWDVVEQETFLQIVPPDPKSNEKGATENYFIIGDSLDDESIRRADDPQVVSYLDEFVRGNLTPMLQRVGQITPLEGAQGPGALITWEVKSPEGKVIRAQTYTGIFNDHGVALLAFGFKECLDARDEVLRKMFASFGFGQGEKDPALVGTWALVSQYDIWTPVGNAETRVTGYDRSESRLEFRPDGSWTRTDVTEFLAMGGGTNPITGAPMVLESGPERKVSQGTWSAGGGSLFMMWQDRSWEEFKYEAVAGPAGPQLKLRCGRVGETWKRL